jgi:hypothetical protein
LKHEIRGEPVDIAFNRLIELFCLNAVELREVPVQHHFMPADQENAPFDVFDGEERFHEGSISSGGWGMSG